jgi:hypothetical protein
MTLSTLWLVNILPKSATQHAVLITPACCSPQTWEHVGVMAYAVKMLDAGGIGPENHTLLGLDTPNFAVLCPIEAN